MSKQTVHLLSVVLPAHNEELVVGPSLQRLSEYLKGQEIPHELILVADGCTDRTVDIARELSIPELAIHEQWPNGGKGSALRHGIMLARGDRVVLMDADLDIHPESIGQLILELETGGFDVVVGAKTHARSEVDYPRSRRVLSAIFRLLARRLFDLPVSDTQTGLKVFRREALRRALPKAESDGFAFDLELLVAINDLKYKISEGPVRLDYKFDSRVSLSSGFEALVAIFRLWRSRKV